MFQLDGRRKHESTSVFVLFPSIVLEHLELQSSSFEPPIPIMPSDIVANAFALLQDNVSQNSSMK